MGVGYPLDVVVCSMLGIDMFDSVFPTRTARFGSAFVFDKRMAICGPGECVLKLRHRNVTAHLGPVDETCPCLACHRRILCHGKYSCHNYYTRSYVNQMLAKKAPLACQLLTHHNVVFMHRVVRNIRRAIHDRTACVFVSFFSGEYFPSFTVSRETFDPFFRGCQASTAVTGKRKFAASVSPQPDFADSTKGHAGAKRRRLRQLCSVPSTYPFWIKAAFNAAMH